MENNNLFDIRDTEAQDKIAQGQAHKAKILRAEENSLYALVFNSEAGRKLLDKWVNTYVHTWIAQPNDTQIGIGVKQGQANFVMDIMNRLKQIEKGVNNG